MSMEQAEEYIRSSRQRREELGRIKESLGIRGRELTATEQKYISSWLDMGFGEDCIALAYDRTVLQCKELRWSYLGKILQNWHQKGLHTVQEVQEGDRRPAAQPQQSRQSPGKNVERMK